MLNYILSIVLGWIGIKVAVYIWNYYRICKLVAPVPRFEPQHWFWGFLYKVKTVSDLLTYAKSFVQRTGPDWFSAWNMFLYPLLFTTNPTTMQQILTAKNVPKNVGMSGGYRMLMPWIGEGLLVSNGKKWERSRRLLTPAFHFDILKGYVEDFNYVADTLLSKLKELSASGDSFDVFPPVSRATLDSMLRCTVSYMDDSVQNTSSHHPYVVAVNKIASLVEARWITPFYMLDCVYYRTAVGKEFLTYCEYTHKFSSDIIKKRRKELEKAGKAEDAPRKRHLDFLDTLLTAKDGDGQGLTDQEIRDEVDTFVFEGHDTTASGISWMLYALGTYPKIQAKVRQEVEALFDGRNDLEFDDLSKLHYTTCFIKESMRVYPPVPGMERQLSEPLTINGVTLPAGTNIEPFVYCLHHNPSVWEDPEKFDPDRFLPDNIKNKNPYAFLPFSAGQRNCIGQHFAMNEMKIMICKIVRRFDIKADPTKPAEEHLEVVLRAKNGIHLYFKDRQ